MNCFYCQQEWTLDTTEKYWCGNHKIPVFYDVDSRFGYLYRFFYFIDYKGRTYKIAGNVYSDKQEFVFGESLDFQPLIELNYIPTNITPDNIDQKLPMLLTWM
jgi:hypothetical protein